MGRPGLDPRHVTPSPRLRHAVGTHHGLVYQHPEVFLLLLMVASDHDGHGAEAVSLDGGHNASAAIRHLLSNETAVQSPQAHAAILLGDVEVHKTGGMSLLEDIPGILSCQ